MNIKDFIKEVKPFVIFDKELNIHLLSNTLLGARDIRIMLSNYYKDEYDHLPRRQKDKLVRQVFEELK